MAVGTYLDDAELKTTIFTPANARYVKITSMSEAGDRGPFMSIAEVNVYEGTDLPPPPATAGSWGLTIDFPLVPVSAAIEWSSGRLLVWSSFSPSNFYGDSGHQTVTAIYDPVTQVVSPRTVTNVGHDMFCEGLSMDADGRIVATGGNSDYGTSIYDSTSDSWSTGGVSDYLDLVPFLNCTSWALHPPFGQTSLDCQFSKSRIGSENSSRIPIPGHVVRWSSFHHWCILVWWIFYKYSKEWGDLRYVYRHLDRPS